MSVPSTVHVTVVLVPFATATVDVRDGVALKVEDQSPVAVMPLRIWEVGTYE